MLEAALAFPWQEDVEGEVEVPVEVVLRLEAGCELLDLFVAGALVCHLRAVFDFKDSIIESLEAYL